ncbi:FAD-binding oxidoreductase [Cypionkella sp.]|uniref:NAD(P)/FAD-dependent oxidoreductase n=1 Tax=Cypionkella sp. TaxID=2811411 RepID=UPI002726E17B|nr:FAD-binding oxidoreductase [Cypionkella sp.]MDO8983244.1 FAD-binding oxidoreductase [Cypionkella sp.]MDP2048511.1 FAD-binding oxidoreductase [Cypionkella sp.]
MPQSVLIIGAGIIGASLAFHLARAGAKVTVLESASPASAASGRSFGWINASFYASPAHHHLRVAAMSAHHRLAAVLSDHAPNWQGTLWFEHEGQGFDQKAEELAALGYPATPVTRAEIAKLEPHLANPPAQALHIAIEGAVDPVALTRALLAASGAKILSGIAAKSLIENGGQIKGVRTAIGPFSADHTVLAAGIATPALLAPIGLDLPMLARPGIMVYSKPVGWRVNHILVTPDQEIRQDPSGALLAPGVANHQADASESIAVPSAMAEATIHRLRARFNAPDLTLDRFALGYRPVPADGLPLIGTVQPGLSLAVMHSGITLSALAGEALAAEIMGQGEHPLLADFRPGRLLKSL